MDTQEIAARIRVSNWAEMVRERISSGQSIRSFCKENGISKSTYYHRQRKVREAACVELSGKQAVLAPRIKSRNVESIIEMPSGWVHPVEINDGDADESQLIIEVGGCIIKVSHSTDVDLLTKTCRVLKSL